MLLKNTLLLVFLTQVILQSSGHAETSGLIQDISFTSRADGTVQYYILILPDSLDATQKHDLLIALHGHGSDRWQFATGDRDEVRAAKDTAEEHQMIYVSPDYRAKTSWMGPLAEQDTLQIIEEIKQRYAINRVVLCGGSMGGTSCLTFAALHPELVQGVVSMNGTANHLEYEGFQDAISASFGGSKTKIPLEYKNRSAEYWPERLTMPIAFTTGGKDELVPPGSVLRLAAILRKIQPNVYLNHREEGGHSTSYADAMDAFRFVMEKVILSRE
jgi:pimeloyl-ACP methyl ester carboxylesterase